MSKRENAIRVLCAGAAMLFLAACDGKSPTQASQSLRLYVFDCGAIGVLDISLFHPGIGKGAYKQLTNSCYLVVHPKGKLLWDTGLADSLIEKREGVRVRDTFIMRVKNTLQSQLQAINVAPESIEYLGLSHMHGDHLGNAPLFPKAKLLIQKAEYDAAFGPNAAKFGFQPSTYPTLAANPVQTLQGDHDVFGDGSVTIKSTPGHTPGHQSLYVRLPKSGNIFLSGDVVHFTENWEHKYVPAANFDKAQSVKTMNDVEQFLKDNNAQLWIQHDAEQNAKIKHAPEYYE
jgi:N-acyl homoserine lactone hydrolase